MTFVVGLTWPIEHDNSVAAIVDGELVFASEEERFSRHKHSEGEPPVHAMVSLFQYVSKLGLDPTDVDAFAISWDPNLMFAQDRKTSSVYSLSDLVHYGYTDVQDLMNSTYRYLDGPRKLVQAVYRKLGVRRIPRIKIVPVSHHLAHAASAFYFSGWNSAATMTVDGSGEKESTVIWKVKRGQFERIISMPTLSSSIGFFYEFVSARLHFDQIEGPGKVMGLAPYGKFDRKIHDRFSRIIKIHENGDQPYSFEVKESRRGPIWRSIATVYGGLSNRLTPTLDLGWDPHGELRADVVNLAWTLQDITEKLILATAQWAKNHSGESKLAMAGGVALNAKANMRLHYSRLFNDLFVFPASNDAGAAAGAAAYVHDHTQGVRIRHGMLQHVFLGPEYEADEVTTAVRASKWRAEYVGEAIGETANLLRKGSIVGWYQGRLEFGPRALGHRSILADPRDKEMRLKVNRLKGREWWRPLSPSVVYEDMRSYFASPVHNQFMTMMFGVNSECIEQIAAVTHVDHTARVQSVKENDDKLWYEQVKAFKEGTGVGALLNTSYNLDGAPIVESPKDALASFASGPLDALYLQGWLITKPK